MGIRNKVLEFLKFTELSLCHYDWYCNYLAYDTQNWARKGDILWIYNPYGMLKFKQDERNVWFFHCVYVLNGIVHDPLVLDMLTVNSYLKKYFGDIEIGLVLGNANVSGNPYQSSVWRRVKRLSYRMDYSKVSIFNLNSKIRGIWTVRDHFWRHIQTVQQIKLSIPYYPETMDIYSNGP